MGAAGVAAVPPAAATTAGAAAGANPRDSRAPHRPAANTAGSTHQGARVRLAGVGVTA
jgi:hypothetical protein